MPDPSPEIRIVALHSLRGANYWSQRPVTRMDVVVGSYEDISSADVPGLVDALARTMPGLIEHRCSIGERGGFLQRLRCGTYAPHIIEHVALELQAMAGCDVGYGKTRGGDEPGEYSLVFEHCHANAGLRAAALALEVVQHAFTGTLDSVDHAVREVSALLETPDAPALRQRVRCGITGGGPRHETRDEMARLGLSDAELVVDVAPGYLLQAGLPYARSDMAIILDAELSDVPERYRDPERGRQLVGVLTDAVSRDGIVVVPAKEWELQDYARDRECRVAIFATDDDVTRRDKRVARAVALVREGRIVLESIERTADGGDLRPDAPAAAQVAAALAMFTIEGLEPERCQTVMG
ncbi:MAG: cyanophycin synthetase family protein [Gemmatimonadaceae bacterium]